MTEYRPYSPAWYDGRVVMVWEVLGCCRARIGIPDWQGNEQESWWVSFEELKPFSFEEIG